MTQCPARIKAVVPLSNDCTAQMVNTCQLYAVLFYQSEEMFLSVNAHPTTRLTCVNRANYSISISVSAAAAKLVDLLASAATQQNLFTHYDTK